MKIEYIKLINYVGIYNGLGLEDIEINLSKAKSKIILIRGLNGSGKTTILNSLSPLPDNNDSILKNREGVKLIKISHNDFLYSIRIDHPVKTNGERGIIRATIQKSYDGGKDVELNPNGNITTYKEIISSEFGLDSNFEILSRLSTEDKGIASKTPSERKLFVNNILEELNDYNNIHKTIVKRSSMFKSMVNRLESKIERIGNPEELKLTLQSIEHRLDSMNSERDNINKSIANISAEINMVDPGGNVQARSQDIYNKIEILNKALVTNDKALSKYTDLKDIDNIQMIKETDRISRQLTILENQINNMEEVITRNLREREEDMKEIQIKTSKLNSLYDQSNYTVLLNGINELEENIKEWNSILIEIGYDIKGEINLTKDEYLLGINTLRDIKEIIDTFRSGMEYNVIETTINEFVLNGLNPDKEYYSKMDDLDKIKLSIESYNLELSGWKAKLNIMKSLELRPTNCKIDSCAFIKESLDISKENPESRIAKLEDLIYNVTNDKILCENNISIIRSILECYNYISRIVRLINSNKSILLKLPTAEMFTDSNEFLKRILRNDKFKEIETIQQYIQYCDIFSMYNISKNKLYRLKSDLKVFESKEELINEILLDLDKLNSRVDTMSKDIESIRNSIFEKRKLYQDTDDKIKIYKSIIEIVASNETIISEKNLLLTEFKLIKDSIEAVSSLKNTLNLHMNRLKSIDSDIPSVTEDRDTIKYNLRQLKEFKIEYDEYLLKYNKIQEIKFHSSPTTGIQLIFIKLYMSNTINLANNLLAMLFDGEYFIEPFIINDREFRIPCRGNGALNDDISSMSTGQISMIAMVLSFVMLKQAATDYNIIRLDEIDAGLDSINRVKILLLLEKQMDLLQVEQCNMISHNQELDISNCSIIMLKMDESEKASIHNSGANIIYEY